MIKKTQIMGILNITPDSFSDGGLYFNDPPKALARASQMIAEGADIIDLGAESTRPGASSISADEELKRIIPVIKILKKQLKNIRLSIDTNKSQVASEILKYDIEIINSLGGFSFDPRLAEVIARSTAKILIYHIKGTPRTMQQGDIIYKDTIGEINSFFEEQIKIGINAGIKKEKFILDPGIGFGKTIEQNLHIIKNINGFKKFALPIAIGVSRKSHLGKILQDSLDLNYLPEPHQRLEAALAETAIAVTNGAEIIRTHDIGPTKKFLTILDMLK